MKLIKIAIVLLATMTCSTAFAKEKRTDLLATTLGYDIIKQGEKLENDPNDIKETDLLKFKYVCRNGEFNRSIRKNDETYIQRVDELCETIIGL